MPTFIVKNNPGFQKPLLLSQEDQSHLLYSLRANINDLINVTDNAGHIACTQIISLKPLELKILEIKSGEKPLPLTVYLPLIDKDRLEWAVQKLCEINIQTIQLVITERTQIKKLSSNRLERLHKIATEAQKQCGRCFSMDVRGPVSLNEIVIDPKKLNFVGSLFDHATLRLCDLAKHDNIAQSHSRPVTQSLFLGPEGGFTESELKHFDENKVQKINLGQTILKTETAAIALSSIIKYFSP